MTLRYIKAVTLALGLSLAGSSFAKEPARTTPPAKATANANQQLADKVAQHLSKSGVAEGARIQLVAQRGVVELHGTVLSVKQAEKIAQQTMLVSGVTRVESYLKVMTSLDITPVQAVDPAPLVIPGAPAPNFGGSGNSPMTLAPGAGVGVPPQGVPQGFVPQDPVPLQGPAMPAYNTSGPNLPPYAWPTYAPYNNMSRVAYPQAYPYNAFPFIGPFYPFPKVPLGWRSVKLEWEDGHWYLGRLSTPHDYWRVRFW